MNIENVLRNFNEKVKSVKNWCLIEFYRYTQNVRKNEIYSTKKLNKILMIYKQNSK